MIQEHESSFENIDPEKIVAAYCTIEMENGQEYTEVMNMAQIQKSWAKSRNPKQSVHKEFPDQMAKRTVINRACKMFFNTSDDSDLLIEAFNNTSDQYDDSPDIPDSTPKRPIDSRAATLNSEFAQKSSLPAAKKPAETIEDYLDEEDEA